MDDMPADRPSAPDTALLDMDDASVMRDGRLILQHVTLRVSVGRHTAILGANGAGKSTLVKLITRQIYPLARSDGRGPVRVFGRERWNVAELRGLLGIVSPAWQHDFTATGPLPAFDAVVSGFFAARGTTAMHRVSDAMRQRAHEALERMDAGHLAERDLGSLSTGEARRVMIARALVHRPRALLLDEPCAGLDLVSRRRFLEDLRSLARDGTTLLMVTHHVEEILPEIGHLVLLREGRVWRHGRKSALLTDTALGTTFGMPVRVRRRGRWYHAALD